jgi:tetratricopeptide (TPR) repeat protein
VLLGSALIAAAVYLTRQAPEAAVERDDQEQQRLAAERKRLGEQRAALEGERRKVELAGLLARADAALAKGEHAEAEKLYRAALKIDPADEAALKGLLAATSALAAAGRAGADEATRKADLETFLSRGRQAVKEKRYGVAVAAFEAARRLAPADEGILKELLAAQAAADADAAEKKTRADYQAHLDAGRVALAAGRYADAVREFLAAQRVVPNDPDAVDGQRKAEAQLAALADRDKREAAFKVLFDRATKALQARRFTEGIDALEAALRLIPDDREASRLLLVARGDLRKAKAEYKATLGRAETALGLRRFEEAQRLYAEAAALLPEDPAAAKGLRDVERLVAALRTAQTAYVRYMNQGAVALRARRYADAAVAYSEALNLVPGDLDAAAGLRQAREAAEGVARAGAELDRLLQAAAAALDRSAYNAAIAAYNKALKLAPDDPRITGGLSKARYRKYMAEGRQALLARRRADAIRAYERALEEKPDDSAAAFGLRSAKALR